MANVKGYFHFEVRTKNYEISLMKQEDGAGVDALRAVGMTAASLVDIDPLLQWTALHVGAVPTVGKVGGMENVGTKAVEDIKAVALGKG